MPSKPTTALPSDAQDKHGPAHVGKAPVGPGSSPPAEGEDLQMPHERDEAAGNVSAQPVDIIRQAGKDIEAGLVDTDMRATPGLDAERREQLVGASAPQVDAPMADSTVGPGSHPKAPRTDRPGAGRRR